MLTYDTPALRQTGSREAFLDPSDSYFLFAEERGYHRWALAHSSSCLVSCPKGQVEKYVNVEAWHIYFKCCILWNLQMRSLVCRELSKHVTHYGQWSGFPYYNLTTPILRGIPLSTTQRCLHQNSGSRYIDLICRFHKRVSSLSPLQRPKFFVPSQLS
jgi:hypothetical protein